MTVRTAPVPWGPSHRPFLFPRHPIYALASPSDKVLKAIWTTETENVLQFVEGLQDKRFISSDWSLPHFTSWHTCHNSESVFINKAQATYKSTLPPRFLSFSNLQTVWVYFPYSNEIRTSFLFAFLGLPIPLLLHCLDHLIWNGFWS